MLGWLTQNNEKQMFMLNKTPLQADYGHHVENHTLLAGERSKCMLLC